ncbi:MAG: cytochrome c [Phycisphaera sp.]|nr:MAG: cytochrome c [Phycisphaera sp.]
MNHARTSMLLGFGLAAIVGTGIVGCRGERSDKPPRQFFPDMDDQEHFRPQNETEFFADGRSQRPSVPGTVGYGRAPIDHAEAETTGWGEEYGVQRARLLREDKALYSGTTDAPVDDPAHYIDEIPVEVTMDLIRLGQENFDIYCAICHGYEGDGYGTVGDRYAVRPANFHDPKYTNTDDILGRDGYLYSVARNGLYDPAGAMRMPGYAHALDEYEAWAVVAYIRTLQASRGMSIDDDIIPGAERNRLLEQRGTPVGSADQPASQEQIAEGGEQ